MQIVVPFTPEIHYLCNQEDPVHRQCSQVSFNNTEVVARERIPRQIVRMVQTEADAAENKPVHEAFPEDLRPGCQTV